MPIAKPVRSAAGLAACVALSLSAAAQAPPATDPAAGAKGTPQVPARVLPPGYNPGEMLKDLANPVVAEVDGHQITLAEVGDAIRALPDYVRGIPFEELYPGVLERLIQKEALVAKARRMQLDIDPVIQRRMRSAAESVLENELLNRLLGQNISEQALLARYQQDYAGKPGPEEVNVLVIMLPTEDAARKVLAELTAGADFSEVARKQSRDASATRGGELGFLRQDQLLPELGIAAFLLEPGQISPTPISSGGGWFVVKSGARRRAPPPGFTAVREKLRQQIMREGVKNAAEEAVSEAEVHRFNMNGTSMVGKDESERRAARKRP